MFELKDNYTEDEMRSILAYACDKTCEHMKDSFALELARERVEKAGIKFNSFHTVVELMNIREECGETSKTFKRTSNISPKDMTRSKFMSLVLRHKPEEIGLLTDSRGYLETVKLLKGMNAKGIETSFSDLVRIVEEDDQERYSFKDNRKYIRANQGHSFPVNLELEYSEPPDILYHGTSIDRVTSIFERGISKQGREDVHLSATTDKAARVGKRHGELAIIQVNAKAMYSNQHKFRKSKNGVWLVEYVPPEYLMNYR